MVAIFISPVSVFGLVLRPARYALRGYLFFMEKWDRFWRLVIVREIEKMVVPSGCKFRRFLCKCDCWNEKNVLASHLKSGKIQSCRCLQKERVYDKLKNKNHIMNVADMPEYSSWSNMKTRCLNEKSNNFSDWWGRWIKMSNEWEKSFDCFYSDMGKKPHEKSTIDRIDVDGDYCKENCRWADWTTQRENQRRTIYYDIGGFTLTLKGHCRRLDLNYKRVWQRVHRLWWTIEDSLR